MDFSYAEQHHEIKQLAEDILKDFSQADRLKKLEADPANIKNAYFDQALWQQFVRSGLHSAAVPEAFGGMGFDFHTVALVAEAIGRHAVQSPFISAVASTLLPLLSLTDSKPVLDCINGFLQGEQLITTALIEPGNEDPFLTTTQAIETKGLWKLNGIKHCVPYAQQSKKILLFAQSSDGLWAGLLQREQSGVSLTAQQCTAGEPQYHLQCHEADAHCIAQGHDAEQLLRRVLAYTLSASCAMAAGCADQMMRISGQYTSQREQFGVRIATFQAVAHRLADCYIDVDCLKSITLKAVSDVNNGAYTSDSLSMAKYTSANVLHRVSHAAQHVHGGMGIDRDYHLFRYCLWAKQLELSLGNARQHLTKLADGIEQRYLTSA